MRALVDEFHNWDLPLDLLSQLGLTALLVLSWRALSALSLEKSGCCRVGRALRLSRGNVVLANISFPTTSSCLYEDDHEKRSNCI